MDPFAHKAQFVKARTKLIYDPAAPDDERQDGFDLAQWRGARSVFVNWPFSQSARAMRLAHEWCLQNPGCPLLALCLTARGSNYWRECGATIVATCDLPRVKFHAFLNGETHETEMTISRDVSIVHMGSFRLHTYDEIIKRFARTFRPVGPLWAPM